MVWSLEKSIFFFLVDFRHFFSFVVLFLCVNSLTFLWKIKNILELLCHIQYLKMFIKLFFVINVFSVFYFSILLLGFVIFLFVFLFFARDKYLYTIFIVYCFSSFECVCVCCFLSCETVCVVNVLYKIRYSWMRSLNYGTICCSFEFRLNKKKHSTLQFLFHH